MAHSPRKPSPGRQPTPSAPADDLFGSDFPSADSTLEPPPENWTLDDGPSAPAKQTSLPPATSLPSAQPVPVSPVSVPGKNTFESNPNPPADAILEAVPVPARTVSGSPAPRPVAEVYDPFDIDEELPAPIPPLDPLPVLPGDSGPPPAPEEFHVASPDDASEEAPPSEHLSAGTLKPAGMIAVAVVLIALMGSFIGILYLNRPAAEIRDSRRAPTVPLAGGIATLSAIESGWRSRQSGDLVSTVDVTLPTPSRQTSALLPQVKFTLDSAATKAGFLRFIFLDPDGKISGDVRVVKVNGGTIEPLSSGAVLSDPGTAAVYGSLGFMDRPGFVAYAASDTARWSVEVSESADYNAKQDGWTKLETFDLRNTNDL